MHYLQEFLLTFPLTVLFLWQVENLGFLLVRAVKLVSVKTGRQLSWEPVFWNQHIFQIFLGLLVFGMLFFGVGVARMLSREIVLGLTLIVSLSIFVIHRRWREYKLTSLRLFWNQNKANLLGVLLFFGLTFGFTFRPITNFDALWYHLTIPKFFLQEGNIDYLGLLTRYSVHPYINFFWNMWPLSLPISIPLQGMVVNFVQTIVVALGLLLANQFGAQLFNWGKLTQLVAPSLLGINLATIIWYGAGYNDLYGMVFGLLTALYAYYLSRKDRIYFDEFLTLGLLIAATFLIKLFFAMFACLVFVYFFATSLGKLEFLLESNVRSRAFWRLNNLKLLALPVLAVLGIFILPWLIRSFVFTGRILDPVGAPGMSEDLYWYAGSNTPANHWFKFVWYRLYHSLGHMFIWQYSPLFMLGALAFLNQNFWQKYRHLWLLAVGSFGLIFFLSIVLEWRYFLPSAALLAFLGLTVLGETRNYLSERLFNISLLVSLFLLISITWYSGYHTDGRGRDMYLLTNESIDTFLAKRSGTSIFDYYASGQTPRPKDLNKQEKIFVIGVHNLAYIENPILDIYAHGPKFDGIKTTQELVELLKAENVRFILSKRQDIISFCRERQFTDWWRCTNDNDYWTVDVYDEPQQATWYRLK